MHRILLLASVMGKRGKMEEIGAGDIKDSIGFRGIDDVVYTASAWSL